jgi:hypothetical protein
MTTGCPCRAARAMAFGALLEVTFLIAIWRDVSNTATSEPMDWAALAASAGFLVAGNAMIATLGRWLVDDYGQV